MDPSVTSKMSKSPRAAFGSLETGRLSMDKQSVPGPGSYNSTQEGSLPTPRGAVLNGGPQRAKLPGARSRDSTPDPGSYSMTSVQSTSKMGRSPSYGFASSRADRFPMLKERAPGPGSYNNLGTLGGAGGGFLSSPRNPERRIPETPDPGHYSARDPSATSKMNHSPRHGFGSLDTGRTNLGKEAVPGPGAYEKAEDLTEHATTFGGAPRVKEFKPRTESPDPGHYNAVDPASTSRMSKQSGYGWGTSDTGRILNGDSRKSPNEKGPTPQPPKSPRISNPGPGSYNVVDYQDGGQRGAAARSFGSEASRPSLGLQSRSSLATPGPGTYVRGSKIGEGPKYSMRSRSAEKSKSTPGPGQYGGSWTQFD